MSRQGRREGGREGFRRRGGKKGGDARVGNEVRVWIRSGTEKGGDRIMMEQFVRQIGLNKMIYQTFDQTKSLSLV